MPADDVEAPAAGGRVRRFALRYWVALILVALAAIFIAQNRDRANIHILWITVAAPMWFIFAGLRWWASWSACYCGADAGPDRCPSQASSSGPNRRTAPPTPRDHAFRRPDCSPP